MISTQKKNRNYRHRNIERKTAKKWVSLDGRRWTFAHFQTKLEPKNLAYAAAPPHNSKQLFILCYLQKFLLVNRLGGGRGESEIGSVRRCRRSTVDERRKTRIQPVVADADIRNHVRHLPSGVVGKLEMGAGAGTGRLHRIQIVDRI